MVPPAELSVNSPAKNKQFDGQKNSNGQDSRIFNTIRLLILNQLTFHHARNPAAPTGSEAETTI